MPVQIVHQRVGFGARERERRARYHDQAVAHQPKVDRVGPPPAALARVAAAGGEAERAGGERLVFQSESFLQPGFHGL